MELPQINIHSISEIYWEFSCSVFFTALNIFYFFFVAKTIYEYSQSIFITTTMISITICFVYSICLMRTLFDCIDDAEQLINDRKFKFIKILLRI